MNRPYYALAALVVVLGGSAVAVGSARCQSATASIDSSRALCASGPRDLVVAASLFVQFDTSWEASRRASFAGTKQGSDDNSLSGYDDSCGYDPYRGERYDAETCDWGPSESLIQEYESWPSDERIDSGFRQFEGCEMQPVCGGNELHCPYFAGGAANRDSDECAGSPCEEALDISDDDCQRAHERWLAEQESNAQSAPVKTLDESAFFVEPTSDAWKTAPVVTPNWITDYLSACMPSLEEQYAQAELQAAQDAEAALAEYGPTLPETPSPESANYKEEYESLYNLDAYLIPEREVMEEVDLEATEDNNGARIWSLGRIFGKVAEMFDEILPIVEDQADDLQNTVDDVLQQWNDLSSRLAMPRDDVAVLGPYSEEYGEYYYDSIISRDEQKVESEPALPVETVQSREMLTSIASSLRAAGQLLLSVADGLEAEAERVLSAQYEDYWSR